MLRVENIEIHGLEPAIRGMRNPMNSWDKSDSRTMTLADIAGHPCDDGSREEFVIGENDIKLMTSLANGGPVHAKYRRMIVVWMDIIAPLYFWKEFDTYKVGTVANSCSTMHKIADKPFDRSDFSWEHIEESDDEWVDTNALGYSDAPDINNYTYTELTVELLNYWRDKYNSATDKVYKKSWWWQMIQLLPSSYNQRRTVMLNYEVLSNMYRYRWSHKLDEWVYFCKVIEGLPYSQLITDLNRKIKD